MSFATRAYRSVAVETATPTRILDELFQRFDRDCGDALGCLQRKDIAGRGRAIGHAVQIVGALASALDRSAGEALYRDLSRLYDYSARALLEANLEGRADRLESAREVMRELHSGFRGAIAAS